MGKLAAESWIGRTGLIPRGRRNKGGAAAVQKDADENKPAARSIEMLAFEVASLMSKAAQIWLSLADDQIARLRDGVLRLPGVRKLVSSDDDLLLGLALSELFDSVGILAASVARLGNRCSDPLLQRFEHVFVDLLDHGADMHGWEYTEKKMEKKVKEMETLAAACARLYQEMEVVEDLEQELRRMLAGSGNQPPASQIALMEHKHKIIWHRQEVKSLKAASLWTRSYDLAVMMLARSLFTIVARIRQVFGLNPAEEAAAAAAVSGDVAAPIPHFSRSRSSVSSPSPAMANQGAQLARFPSGPIACAPRSRSPAPLPPPPLGKQRSRSSKTNWVSGPFLRGCRILIGGGGGGIDSSTTTNSPSSLLFGGATHRRRPMNAIPPPPSTLGAAGLALHYANLVVVIDKLVSSPHLIGPDARDDLYRMLTASIRAGLRARLKKLECFVYDAGLAAEWSEAMERILQWLSPLAHNMIRWQSERSFQQQQHMVAGDGAGLLLLQTLYFANLGKTEAAITELLVGLNYLWRFGREMNAKAILECLSSSSRNLMHDVRGISG